jgi:hypothetical protein
MLIVYIVYPLPQRSDVFSLAESQIYEGLVSSVDMQPKYRPAVLNQYV